MTRQVYISLSVLRGRWTARELPNSDKDRIRTLIDKLQVLCLEKPLVALWALNFLEGFIDRQLRN